MKWIYFSELTDPELVELHSVVPAKARSKRNGEASPRSRSPFTPNPHTETKEGLIRRRQPKWRAIPFRRCQPMWTARPSNRRPKWRMRPSSRSLVHEIIIRVGFPTSLVHAAAVCRRWLGHASDRAFLRRFRELHPPRLLGFYLAKRENDDPHAAARFFPTLPQPPPPELAAVVRRSSFSLGFYDGARTNMVACWNGRVVTSLHESYAYNHNEFRDKITFVVHSPLRSEKGMSVIRALHLPPEVDNSCSYKQLFSKEEGDVVSYFYLIMLESTREAKSMVQVFMLRTGDDAWHTDLTFTVDCLFYIRSQPKAVLVDNKIYMASTRSQIVVLDLTASSLSTIQLPLGVDCHTRATTMLSRGEDASAVYLINAKRLQIHIWLYKGDNWLLVDKICLRETCARLFQDEPPASFRINHATDYIADFLFLEIGRFAFCLDVKCRTLRKVYEMTREDRYLGIIYPFMMIWPLIFPALKDGPASNATWSTRSQGSCWMVDDKATIMEEHKHELHW